MSNEPARVDQAARALARALLVVLGVALLLWIVHVVALPLVVGLSAIVVAVALNGPVTWLERRGWPRVAGTLALLLAATLVVLSVAVVVGARLAEETASLVEAAPTYLEDVRGEFNDLIGRGDGVDSTIDGFGSESTADTLRRAIEGGLSRIGSASITIATLAVIAVTWVTMVAYLAIEPRSLLRGLLRLSPVGERDAVERVFLRFSAIVRAWLWANLLVGTIEAVLVVTFLTWLDIPAAIVWGALTLFAVFIPKVGAWIMAVPPTLVALAVDPGDAIWVVAFYVLMNEVMSDVVLPRIQSGAMDLHAFYLVLFVLAFGGVFGLAGAIIATPLAGLVAAAFDEWVLSRRPDVEDESARVERLLGAEPA